MPAKGRHSLARDRMCATATVRPPTTVGRSVLARRFADRSFRSLTLTRSSLAGVRGRRIVPARRRSWVATFHDVLDLSLVDRLVLHQGLGHLVQLVEVVLQDGLGALIVGINQDRKSVVEGKRGGVGGRRRR